MRPRKSNPSTSTIICDLKSAFQTPLYPTISNTLNMENGTTTQGEGKDPSSFLSEIIGNQVTVKLNSGVVYKGAWAISEGEMLV